MKNDTDLTEYRGWNVKAVMGRGAFGIVYRVEKTEYDIVREAALKVSKVSMSDFDIKEEHLFYNVKRMLLNEAKTFYLLKHKPNIVNCFDYEVKESSDGKTFELFILMELLTPLNQFVDSHGMTENQIIQIGLDISRALVELEKLNIVHHDIKPSNIFANGDGQFVLGDFSTITKYSSNNQSKNGKNSSSGIKGTLNYMPPEALFQKYDKTTDLYSLGMVLYSFMNDGFLPFLDKKVHSYADQEKAYRRRMRGEIPKLNIQDKQLADIILKAIHPDPQKRFQSASEFYQALYYLRDRKDNKNVYMSYNHPIGNDNTKTLIPNPYSLEALMQISSKELAMLLDKSVVILSDNAQQGDKEAEKWMKFIRDHIFINENDKELTLKQYYEKLTDDIRDAVRSMMENSLYTKNTKENSVNDYIRDLLNMRDHMIADQSRMGLAVDGDDAGEVDMRIIRDHSTVALVEALRMSSMKKDYLWKHIQKVLMQYDPVGVKQHYLLVYFNGINFGSFLNRFEKELVSGKMPYTFKSFDILKRTHAGIGEYCAKLERDGNPIELYIFVAKMK